MLKHDSIKTTEARAKEVRPLVEKMITLGKRGTVHARRQALAYIYEPDVVERLFDELAPRYATRPGGYTRVLKLGTAQGRRREGRAARARLNGAPDGREAARSPCSSSTTARRSRARRCSRARAHGAGARCEAHS